MCGIFGINFNKEAAKFTYLGLYALQHRGEESAGIVTFDGKKTRQYKGMGLVGDVFSEECIKSLRGGLAVGHVRYSTTGASNPKNIQPFLFSHKKNHIAIAHNGTLTNILQLRRSLEEKGSIFQTTSDSEIIAHLLVEPDDKTEKKPSLNFERYDELKNIVIKAMAQLEGAYVFVLMLNDFLIGARDPYGWRPLCLGKLDGSYVLASESCALDLIGAEYIREIEPGEVVFIGRNNMESVKMLPSKRHAFCIFEYIYFARPDSNIFGKNVYLTRKRLGHQLAKECPVDCDLVMPVPDSGNYAAIGFAQESGIPLEEAFVRNHYIGRTFIQPSQHIRDFRVRVKLNPVKDVLKGKRIVIIEDSVVRGTTSRVRVKTLREAGAREVHMRISCPPLKFPCFFGIDFPTKKELIASSHSIEWIRDFVGLDSLEYLSLEGMLKAMLLPKEKFCTACFTGNYPIKLPKKLSKYALE